MRVRARARATVRATARFRVRVRVKFRVRARARCCSRPRGSVSAWLRVLLGFPLGLWLVIGLLLM